jgi:hypothetical protein
VKGDPERIGVMQKSLVGKLAEFKESLPGRSSIVDGYQPWSGPVRSDGCAAEPRILRLGIASEA